MKKLITMGVAGLALLSLAACGNTSKRSTSSSSKESVHKVSKPKETAKSSLYFKNNVLKMRDVKIAITKTKVIPIGQKGNEYGKKPVFAIWFNMTNYTNKKISPTDVVLLIKATQETNNSTHELEVASLPDDKFLDTQTDTIKKNGTVPNAVAWEISDSKKPIKLTATTTDSDKEIGHQIYKIE